MNCVDQILQRQSRARLGLYCFGYVFPASVEILCIGVIGEHLGKIYSETEDRPRYVTANVLYATACTDS
jgi:hypothetical protein